MTPAHLSWQECTSRVFCDANPEASFRIFGPEELELNVGKLGLIGLI